MSHVSQNTAGTVVQYDRRCIIGMAMANFMDHTIDNGLHSALQGTIDRGGKLRLLRRFQSQPTSCKMRGRKRIVLQDAGGMT